MPKAMIITVGTGRDRKDIASAICKSISEHNPTEVIFLVTDLSKSETLPLILSSDNVKDKKHSDKLLSDENDVEKIKIECDTIIKEIFKNHKQDEITVDYTSGTKAMSSGIVLSAIANKIGSISYIAGKRERDGRVIPGSERIISFSPADLYANELFAESVRSFNSYQYDVAFQLLDEAKNLFQEQRFIEKANTLSCLANVYSRWDKFLLSESMDLLNRLPVSDFYAEWGVKSKIEKNKQIIYKEVKNKFCEERMIDLFLNAKRRQNEYKYDDAIARLYRLLEYIAQFLIARRELYQTRNDNEIDTSRLNLDKIPTGFQEKYREQIGLDKNYELLNDLKEPLGIEVYSELKNKDSALKRILVIRNNSILAHGFDPVKKDNFTEFFQIIEKYLRKIVKDFDALAQNAEFPKIKL